MQRPLPIVLLIVTLIPSASSLAADAEKPSAPTLLAVVIDEDVPLDNVQPFTTITLGGPAGAPVKTIGEAAPNARYILKLTSARHKASQATEKVRKELVPGSNVFGFVEGVKYRTMQMALSWQLLERRANVTQPAVIARGSSVGDASQVSWKTGEKFVVRDVGDSVLQAEAARHAANMIEFDLMVQLSKPLFGGSYQRSRTVQVKGIEKPVATPEGFTINKFTYADDKLSASVTLRNKSDLHMSGKLDWRFQWLEEGGGFTFERNANNSTNFDLKPGDEETFTVNVPRFTAPTTKSVKWLKDNSTVKPAELRIRKPE